MTWQTAQQAAQQLDGRTPRWCDVRDDEDRIAAAPTDEAMDDCIALDADGNATTITHWMNSVPCGKDVEAVCYY